MLRQVFQKRTALRKEKIYFFILFGHVLTPKRFRISESTQKSRSKNDDFVKFCLRTSGFSAPVSPHMDDFVARYDGSTLAGTVFADAP
jgi:hypothetical protein